MIVCNFKKESETAKLPTKHTCDSAGIDFYSNTEARIPPKGSEIISLGVSWKPEIDYLTAVTYTLSLIIQSRSGLAFKNDIESSNAGVVDADYYSTPEKKAVIKCKLYNNGDEPFYVNVGDKICQGVLHLVPKTLDVKILDDSRNSEGFGSSDGKES